MNELRLPIEFVGGRITFPTPSSELQLSVELLRDYSDKKHAVRAEELERRYGNPTLHLIKCITDLLYFVARKDFGSEDFDFAAEVFGFEILSLPFHFGDQRFR